MSGYRPPEVKRELWEHIAGLLLDLGLLAAEAESARVESGPQEQSPVATQTGE